MPEATPTVHVSKNKVMEVGFFYSTQFLKVRIVDGRKSTDPNYE